MVDDNDPAIGERLDRMGDNSLCGRSGFDRLGDLLAEPEEE
jgi:hypothetical protein